MFIIEIAKLKIQINNKYHYLEKFCEDYIVNSKTFDFSITINDNEIESEKTKFSANYSLGYLESIAAYRKICLEIPKYDSLLIHSCSVKINNKSYLFLAKSGTGKTTHCKLLKEYLKDDLTFINGDKPIIRKIGDDFYAFGTPWNGKERYGENTNAIVKALIFVERATTNSIAPLKKEELLKRIMNQVLLPSDIDSVNKTFNLLNDLLKQAKIYLLKCNMDISAAECSYQELKKGD